MQVLARDLKPQTPRTLLRYAVGFHVGGFQPGDKFTADQDTRFTEYDPGNDVFAGGYLDGRDWVYACEVVEWGDGENVRFRVLTILREPGGVDLVDEVERVGGPRAGVAELQFGDEREILAFPQPCLVEICGPYTRLADHVEVRSDTPAEITEGIATVDAVRIALQAVNRRAWALDSALRAYREGVALNNLPARCEALDKVRTATREIRGILASYA